VPLRPDSTNADWLVPDWPAPAGVHAVFTTRAGGCSVAPFDGLNLGLHVGDDVAQVARNRALLCQAIGHTPFFINQVHGTAVWALGADADGAVAADAACAQAAGQVCTIMVADCLPILLCSTDGRWVAAAHAGWRGLAGEHGCGIVESVLRAFCAVQPMDSAGAAPELIAWLGPCIGPLAFEVGPEVKAVFVESATSTAQVEAVAACFVPHASGKFMADLPALARIRLAAGGVRQIYGNDGSALWCTVTNASRFFSYRRDGATGRMAACIWRD
jgi:YfiH family protein